MIEQYKHRRIGLPFEDQFGIELLQLIESDCMKEMLTLFGQKHFLKQKSLDKQRHKGRNKHY